MIDDTRRVIDLRRARRQQQLSRFKDAITAALQQQGAERKGPDLTFSSEQLFRALPAVVEAAPFASPWALEVWLENAYARQGLTPETEDDFHDGVLEALAVVLGVVPPTTGLPLLQPPAGAERTAAVVPLRVPGHSTEGASQTLADEYEIARQARLDAMTMEDDRSGTPFMMTEDDIAHRDAVMASLGKTLEGRGVPCGADGYFHCSTQQLAEAMEQENQAKMAGKARANLNVERRRLGAFYDITCLAKQYYLRWYGGYDVTQLATGFLIQWNFTLPNGHSLSWHLNAEDKAFMVMAGYETDLEDFIALDLMGVTALEEVMCSWRLKQCSFAAAPAPRAH
ncbi:hypothetical protein [Parahaliea mediterranea]|uniref:hypothetical protein n=1 Tax=Parahaliea mediterranea TaxID=651086 RepID=UPI000E2F411E|nr:hypothetical protein [Parahaliea mediterranea]